MSGGWKVLVTRRAERDIAGLDVVVRKRISRALEALSSNPLANARKLSDNELGDFRVRVGDWRIIFDLEGNEVVILRVGHRKEIYRR